MTSEELAIQAISTLTPYFKLGGDEVVKSVAKDLWTTIKSAFKSKPDEQKILQLASLSDEAFRNDVTEILSRELKHNQELFSTIVEQLELVKLRQSATSNTVQIGENNVSVSGQINNSSIAITGSK